MAAALAAAEDGLSFIPSNELLVDLYLRAKVEGKIGEIATAGYFLDADVYSARPWELVRAHDMPARVRSRDAGDGKQWYFFCPVRFLGSSCKKKPRTIAGTDDMECWHSESRPTPVGASAGGGYMQKFSYHVKTGTGPRSVEKPGWIMTEYSISGAGTVLCKVYKSPRGPGRSISMAPSPLSLAMSSGCKRKAADDLEGAASRPSMRQRRIEPQNVEEKQNQPARASTRQGRIEPQNAGEGQSQPEAHPAIEQHDAAVLELERGLPSLEPQNVAAPEPQIVPASIDDNGEIESLETFLVPVAEVDLQAIFSDDEQNEAADLERGLPSVELQNVPAASRMLPQVVPGCFNALTLDAILPLPEWIITPEFQASCRDLFGFLHDEAN